MPSPLQTLVDDMADLRADYSAAKPSRFKRQRRGLLPYGSANDWSLRVPTDYYSVVEQARDMVRNDALIGQMINRAAENILGDGMRPDPQTGDRGFDRELRARWRSFECEPSEVDAAGESDFNGLCHLAITQALTDGDIFGLLLRDGPIQLVEGHRCRAIASKDNIALGVELSPRRKPVAYHFVADQISPMRSGTQFGEGKRYPVRDGEGERLICHLLDRRRASQTRGMSALTPIIDIAGMLDDHLFSAVVAQQIQNCYAIIHEFDVNAEPTADLAQLGARGTTPESDGTTETTEGIHPGMRVKGKPGEKIKGFTPTLPGNNYFPHVKLLITLVSVNLGMPLILALLDASETNFSAWRGAIEQARTGFRRLQNVLRSRFLVPVYRWKVRQWLAEDGVARALAEAGSLDPLAHKWNRPAFPYIDPLKDAQADSHRLENGLVSPRRLFHEQGQEWSEHVAETIDDLSLAIVRAKRRAIQINARFDDGDPIHWRDLLYLPMAAGMRVTVKSDAGAGLGSSTDDDGDDPEDDGDEHPLTGKRAQGTGKRAQGTGNRAQKRERRANTNG